MGGVGQGWAKAKTNQWQTLVGFCRGAEAGRGVVGGRGE